MGMGGEEGRNEKVSRAESIICCPLIEGGMNRVAVHPESIPGDDTPLGKL